MSHTPGPWMLSRGAQGDAFAVEGPTRTVAHVKLAREAEANAYLLAAAPDLLEALKLAEDYMHLWMEHNTGSTELNDLERIEAAIAKAEGRPR